MLDAPDNPAALRYPECSFAIARIPWDIRVESRSLEAVFARIGAAYYFGLGYAASGNEGRCSDQKRASGTLGTHQTLEFQPRHTTLGTRSPHPLC